QLDPRVEPLEQPVARGDVVAEDGLAHHAGRAGQGFGHEAALAPDADAAARAQPDLRLQQPLGGAHAFVSTGGLSRSAASFSPPRRLPISQATPPTRAATTTMP